MVEMGPGDDLFVLSDDSQGIATSLLVDTGAGDDSVSIGGRVGTDLEIISGEGSLDATVSDFFAGENVRIVGSSGNDSITLREVNVSR